MHISPFNILSFVFLDKIVRICSSAAVKPTTKPTNVPTSYPTQQPTFYPTASPSEYPTLNPTAEPSVLPTFQPTSIPTSPSYRPTRKPTSPRPTSKPTRTPTSSPTLSPTTENPTQVPSAEPTNEPTVCPTVEPTCLPSSNPTMKQKPTPRPTPIPSRPTTANPSIVPSPIPTPKPTIVQTVQPTALPSTFPTSPPTYSPTYLPTPYPTNQPTERPSSEPTRIPSRSPSPAPIVQTLSPTAAPTSTPASSGQSSHHSKKSGSSLWVVGVILVILGSLGNNFGNNLVSLHHQSTRNRDLNINSKNDEIEAQNTGDAEVEHEDQEKDGKFDIMKVCSLETLGVTIFVAGNLLTFASFSFAAQSLLASLESVQFVSNVVFVKYVHKEKVTAKMIAAVLSIVVGNTLVVIFSDHAAALYKSPQLLRLYRDNSAYHGYLVTAFVMWAGCHYTYTVYFHARMVEKRLLWRHASVEPFVFAVSSTIVGTQAVLQSKSLALLIQATGRGYNEFARPTLYVILVAWLLFVSYWLNRLKKGLELYPPLFIIPVLQAFFIFFAIICGGIYFEEFASFTPGAYAGFVIGVLLILGGVAGLAPTDNVLSGGEGSDEEISGPDSHAGAVTGVDGAAGAGAAESEEEIERKRILKMQRRMSERRMSASLLLTTDIARRASVDATKTVRRASVKVSKSVRRLSVGANVKSNSEDRGIGLQHNFGHASVYQHVGSDSPGSPSPFRNPINPNRLTPLRNNATKNIYGADADDVCASLQSRGIDTVGELLDAMNIEASEAQGLFAEAGFKNSHPASMFVRPFGDLLRRYPEEVTIQVRNVYNVNLAVASSIVVFLSPYFDTSPDVDSFMSSPYDDARSSGGRSPSMQFDRADLAWEENTSRPRLASGPGSGSRGAAGVGGRTLVPFQSTSTSHDPRSLREVFVDSDAIEDAQQGEHFIDGSKLTLHHLEEMDD